MAFPTATQAQYTTIELFAEPTPQTAPQISPPKLVFSSLLERAFSTAHTAPVVDGRPSTLDAFLATRNIVEALELWLGTRLEYTPELAQRIKRQLTRDLATIDTLLDEQLNTILHHPDLQRMEASWRGLRYLVEQIPEDEKNVQIRALTISWKDVVRDLEKAIEFDQSHLFKKIYSDEFGTAGGTPFSVLLGDYEIHHKPSDKHPYDDISALEKMAGVAACAFAPFVAGVHPSFLDLDNFNELERLDYDKLAGTFARDEYIKWRALREQEDARFVGLTLPRILLRKPYAAESAHTAPFRFREQTDGPTARNFLWGNAIYAFGGVLVRAFSQFGWLANIRGLFKQPVGRENGKDVDMLVAEGGLIGKLPAISFATDHYGIAYKASTDVVVTDAQEKGLGDLGFIPLCQCQDSAHHAFFSNQSIQKPKVYDTALATMNARISSMLQYMLCVARFAHYIKVIGRDKVGSFSTAAEVQQYLGKWIRNYVSSGNNVGDEIKAKYPLREASVSIRERADRPGSYFGEILLRPHYQLDQMDGSVTLRTDLAQGRTN
jgi:type VI secretion system ImpC/EvpB family protein